MLPWSICEIKWLVGSITWLFSWREQISGERVPAAVTLMRRELGLRSNYSPVHTFSFFTPLVPNFLQVHRLAFLFWYNLRQTPQLWDGHCTISFSFPSSSGRWRGRWTAWACSGNETRGWDELIKHVSSSPATPRRLGACCALLWLTKQVLKNSL